MAIDPNIILGLRPSKIELQDPMDQYAKGLALQSLLGKRESEDMQIADEKAVRAAHQQAGGDNARLRSLLQQGGQHRQLQAMDKADLERRDKEASIGMHDASAAKNKYDVAIDKIQRRSSIFSTATDQASWDSARRLVSLNEPDIAAQLPEQFDPVLLKTRLAEGQTLAQKLADEKAKQTLAETARHNRAGEGNAAGQLEVARGNLGTSRERLAMERSQPKDTYDTERGILVNTREGTSRPVIAADGSMLAAKEKPLTEGQGRGQMFGTRAAESDKILQGIEEKISVSGLALKEGAAKLPVIGGIAGASGNALLSKDQQKVEQAQRNFVNAVLRQESGAVINPEEFENAKKQYFVQPGDGKEVIEQKRLNRQSAIEGFRVMAGAAGGKRIEEARGQPNTAVAKKPKLGERQGGYLYKGGDPANPSSWEKV